MKLTRTRYQQGSLTIESRKNADPTLWVYRWREKSSYGKTIQRKHIIGTKKAVLPYASRLHRGL